MMRDGSDRQRSDEGTYVEEVSPEEALALFTNHEPRTAKEVADELGIVRRTAYNKLAILEKNKYLKKKKVGSRAVVWWKP